MTTVSGYESNENSTISTYFQIDDSWKQRTGKGVAVAIIDSGIDATHADLQGKVKESVEARAENKRVLFEPSTAGDSAGHGTAYAVIIARIAPDAEFQSSNLRLKKWFMRMRSSSHLEKRGCLERQMYGRANFNFMRARVLHKT